LKHFTGDLLVLNFFLALVIIFLGDYGDGISVDATVESALDDLTILEGVFPEDLVYIFLGGFDP